MYRNHAENTLVKFVKEKGPVNRILSREKIKEITIKHFEENISLLT